MVEPVASKRVTPPYATPAGLNLFFEKIKTLKPATLTTKWAEDNELPFADAVVSTMKFLGAVQKDGTLNAEFARLRLEGDPFRETLGALVTSAYSAVFDQVDDIRTISEANLNNAFKTAYDVGNPGRYVRPFLTLCELGGLRDSTGSENAPRPRAVRQEPSLRAAKHVDPPKRGTGGSSSKPPEPTGATIQVVLRMDIPWDATIDEVRARVRAVASLGLDSGE